MESERQGFLQPAVQADDAQGIDHRHSGVTHSPPTAPTTARAAGAAPGMPENMPGMAAANVSQAPQRWEKRAVPGRKWAARGCSSGLGLVMRSAAVEGGATVKRRNAEG